MNPTQNMLVCVTQQKTCERLIKKAVELKRNIKGELFVIHVAKNEWSFLDNVREDEALEYLFGISKSVGANLSVLRSDDIVGTIAEFVAENKIDCVIMGQSSNDHKENYFYHELKKLLSSIEIHVIAAVE